MQSIPQILAVASNAGFSGNDLSTAAAIALAESGGDESNYNPEPGAAGGTPPGQGSYGLWQIYWKKHQNFNQAALYDPQYNASAAYSIYAARGNSFMDWTTYTHGLYLAFVPQVLAELGQPDQTAGDGSGDSGVTESGVSFFFSPAMLIVEGLLALWLYMRG